jgi:hypothetical protein
MEISIEERNLQAVIYSKSTEWAHKQEMASLGSRGWCALAYPGPLKKIIFGLRCEHDSRKLIENTVKEGPDQGAIELAEVRSRPGSFDLEIRKLQQAPP